MRETYLRRKKKKEKENHCDFRIATREYFSDCKCGFIHRWITLFALYFMVLSSCLYYTNWGFVLIWLFVARFSALVGGSLVSSLIIVKLFLWSKTTCSFYPCIEGFSTLNKLCLCFFLNFYFVLYISLVLVTPFIPYIYVLIKGKEITIS